MKIILYFQNTCVIINLIIGGFSMENYKANSFDKSYAAAWSADQGGFSYQLAQNLLAYLAKKRSFFPFFVALCRKKGKGERSFAVDNMI
jgi:hypothetical protein